MSRTALAVPLAAFAVLISVSPARGQHFSDWSPSVNLGPIVNSAGGDFFSALSKDGLSHYFTSTQPSRPGWQGGSDIYVSRRASVGEPWGAPQNLGPTINTAAFEGAPSLSIDGHRMYFSSDRPGGFGGNDIYMSRRRDKRDDFGWETPENIGDGVNTDANEASPAIFQDDEADLVTLYFDSNRTGGPGPFTDDVPAHNGNDIYAATLGPDETFGSAVLVAELSTPSFDRQPVLRRDGLEIFFASNRPGGLGALDLWTATRATTCDPWGTPVNLGPVLNSAANDAGPALSFKGTELYFQSAPPPGTGTAFDLYVTTRTKRKGHGHDDLN